MQKDCIFCDIVAHQMPAEIVYEDAQVIVFKDIKPSAPIHLLVTSKKHISSINELEEQDQALVSHMVYVAKQMAQAQKVDKSGYKLLYNVGRGGGQLIDHLHLHLLAGGGKK